MSEKQEEFIVIEDENTWHLLEYGEEMVKEFVKDRILDGIDTSKLKIFKCEEYRIDIEIKNLRKLEE